MKCICPICNKPLEWTEAQFIHPDCNEKIAQLKELFEETRDVYGSHLPRCDTQTGAGKYECTCGFDDLFE